MELNEMEKKLLFQVEGDYQTKILNELYMTVRYSNNSEQREAAEGLMAKLRVLSNAECMDLVKDIQKNYRLPYPARTIGEKIAEARQQSGAEKLKGHDIMALERFDPEVKHISCASRLAPFDIKEVREITMYDELDLDMLGDERTALFLIMSDTDGTFAFLISLIYSILFNRLCERADDVYGGRLPIHVRCLIDEAANIGQIPNLERLMATIRSREISACLVLQAQSQLKALYKDNMDTIIGNCVRPEVASAL